MWSWNELADQYLLEAEDDLAALNQSVRPQMVKEFTHRYKTELLTMWEKEKRKPDVVDGILGERIGCASFHLSFLNG